MSEEKENKQKTFKNKTFHKLVEFMFEHGVEVEEFIIQLKGSEKCFLLA